MTSRVNVPRLVRIFSLLIIAAASGCMHWPLFVPAPAPCHCPEAKEAKARPTRIASDCPTAATQKEKTQDATLKSQTHAVKPAKTSVSTSKQPSPPAKAEPVAAAPQLVRPASSKTVVATTSVPAKTKQSTPTLAQDKKLRVLMIGDSMAATDFGRELQKKLNRQKSVKCYRRGKSSTGLARPDFFDWMSEGEKQVRRANPDVVIVIVGGNDGQDLIDKEKKKRRIFWKGKKWAAAYSKRMTEFIELLKGKNRRILWLELPAMDHKRLEKKLKIIRDVQQSTVSKLGPRVSYIETKPHFYDAQGRLIRTIKTPKKSRKAPLRQDDGIHFSLPGSKYFANRVYKQIMAALKP
jgi:uncharacterized protein